MKPVAFCLFVLLACFSQASAKELYCRVGNAACKGWSYTGRINNDVVCCPGLPGQGFIMNMSLKAPANCKCTQGTAEQYSSSSPTIRPKLVLLLTSLAGLAVLRRF